MIFVVSMCLVASVVINVLLFCSHIDIWKLCREVSSESRKMREELQENRGKLHYYQSRCEEVLRENDKLVGGLKDLMEGYE